MHMVHGNDVRVGMWHMNAGVEERHALDRIKSFHCSGDLLSAGCDPCGERHGQVLEPDMMLFRDDKRVSLADGVKIEKGHDMRILVQNMRWQCARSNLAEQTVLHWSKLRWHGNRATFA